MLIRIDRQYDFMISSLQFIGEYYEIVYHFIPNINFLFSLFFQHVPLLKERCVLARVAYGCQTRMIFCPLIVIDIHLPIPKGWCYSFSILEDMRGLQVLQLLLVCRLWSKELITLMSLVYFVSRINVLFCDFFCFGMIPVGTGFSQTCYINIIFVYCVVCFFLGYTPYQTILVRLRFENNTNGIFSFFSIVCPNSWLHVLSLQLVCVFIFAVSGVSSCGSFDVMSIS